MAAVDAAWLHMDSSVNELIVNAVLWFDEPLDDDVVREAIEKHDSWRITRASRSASTTSARRPGG